MARYKADHKAKAREVILDAAGKRLKKSGFDGVGVDGLMAEAGMTSGAFYSHFASKEELLAEALDRELTRLRESLRTRSESGSPDWLMDFARRYISRAHRDDAAEGCALPALTPDVARANETARHVYEKRVQEIVDTIAEGTVGSDITERRENAFRFLSLMIGAVAVARALPDGPLVDEIIGAAVHDAERLSRTLGD